MEESTAPYTTHVLVTKEMVPTCMVLIVYILRILYKIYKMQYVYFCNVILLLKYHIILQYTIINLVLYKFG